MGGEKEQEREDEGILRHCPCKEQVIDEVPLKPKYPTDFDTFLGVYTSYARTLR